MTNWIDVDDRLPKDEGYYLCVVADINIDISPFILIQRFVNGKFFVTEWHEENVGRRVTHWMSLPELPKERTLDNCSVIRNAAGKPKQYDGKCEGYSNKYDDEPHRLCRECKLNVFYEE